MQRYCALLLLCLLSACQAPEEIEHVEAIPLLPMQRVEQLVEQYDIIPLSAPLHVHDRQYPAITYTAKGEVEYKLFDEVIFPTQVIITFDLEMEQPHVFLARSPHGGCLVTWNEERNSFSDPCTGSRFTRQGKYESGPSPRNLDELPSEVRDNMLWVRGAIIYGEPVR